MADKAKSDTSTTLSKKLSETITKNTRLEAENAALAEEIAAAKAKQAKNDAQIASLEQTVAQLEAEKAALTEDFGKQTAALAAAKATPAEKNAQIASLETDIARVEAENAALTKKLVKRLTARDAMQATLGEKNAQIESLKNDNAVLNIRINSASVQAGVDTTRFTSKLDAVQAELNAVNLARTAERQDAMEQQARASAEIARLVDDLRNAAPCATPGGIVGDPAYVYVLVRNSSPEEKAARVALDAMLGRLGGASRLAPLQVALGARPGPHVSLISRLAVKAAGHDDDAADLAQARNITLVELDGEYSTSIVQQIAKSITSGAATPGAASSAAAGAAGAAASAST